jgi:hypothetical protein
MTSHFEPEWQRLYVEALVEVNPQVLVERVSVAEKAILSRVVELCTSSDDRVEWKAIEDAITGMAVLRREILKRSRDATTAQRTPTIVMPRNSAS